MIAVRDVSEVAPALRQEMLAAGWTQKRLAGTLNFTEKHVSQMFTGKKGISLRHLFTICAHLNVGVVFLPKGQDS